MGKKTDSYSASLLSLLNIVDLLEKLKQNAGRKPVLHSHRRTEIVPALWPNLAFSLQGKTILEELRS